MEKCSHTSGSNASWTARANVDFPVPEAPVMMIKLRLTSMVTAERAIGFVRPTVHAHRRAPSGRRKAQRLRARPCAACCYCSLVRGHIDSKETLSEEDCGGVGDEERHRKRDCAGKWHDEQEK